MLRKIVCVLLLFLLSCSIANAFEQRFVNVGITSFMDGMPLPNGEGFYFYGHDTLYNANQFANQNGEQLPVLIESNALLAQFLYQSDITLLSGKLGADALFIYVTDIDVPPNPLGLTSGGSGFDDIVLGTYLQWDPIMIHGRPLIANRVELSVYFPTGKFNPDRSINPGSDHFSIEPYWAATLFILPRWTLTWRLQYIFNEKNHQSGITPGNAFHGNFATSYAVIPHRLRLGFAAYYFKQVADSRLHNGTIPHSKEQVFAIGPGLLAIFSKRVYVFLNAYAERNVKNRSDGKRIVFGLLTKL